MVRKQVFSAADVVRAGIAVVDAEGWDQLSARKVAENLGSSTAPVYSNFTNMSELASAVVNEAVRLFMAETQKPKSGHPFLDFGLGVLDFALAHPRWYQALFREVQLTEEQHQELVTSMVGVMTDTPDLGTLTEFERNLVLKKMSIFTHGLASEICSGGCDELSRRDMRLLMEEVGEAVMEDARRRAPRTAEETGLFGSWQNCCEPPNDTGNDDNDD